MGSFIDNTLGTSIFGENANDKAAAAQSKATQQANQVLNTGLQNQTEYLNPYNTAGLSALERLAGGTVLDSSGLANDAGYQFRLNQGNTAINNAAAARGMGNSGATLKALTEYGQNFASNEYDKAYGRENDRLSMLAGMGQNAANNLANYSGQWAAQTSNNYLGVGNANAAAEMGKANQQANLLNQGMSFAAAAFSDERLKENITPIPREDLAEMKKILKAYYFNYKNDEHGRGDWAGIMAQDLEKSKVGKLLVIEDAKGNKMIDTNKVMSMFLATMAEEAA